MSVEYCSVLAQGWIVDDAEVQNLDDEVRENLIDNGILVCQNSWTKNSDYLYVFAGMKWSCDDEIITIIPEMLLATEDAPAAAAQFYKLFPAHKSEKPKLHLMVVIF
jgi:hypothetical protein